jgi:hypothetical protein
VHRHARAGPQRRQRLDRLGGRLVDGVHEPDGPVGADGQHRQARSPQALADLGEVRAAPGVAGEVGQAGRAAQHVAQPQGAVAIEEAAVREVLRGHGDELDRRGQRHVLPPVELRHPRQARLLEQRLVAEAAEEARVVGGLQPAQGGQIEVVVVVVAEHHGVDGRQILEAQPGPVLAAGAGEGHRAGPQRPDRIGQQVDAVLLDQHRGVVDEGDPQPGDPRRRRRPGRGLAVGPGAALAVRCQRRKAPKPPWGTSRRFRSACRRSARDTGRGTPGPEKNQPRPATSATNSSTSRRAAEMRRTSDEDKRAGVDSRRRARLLARHDARDECRN